MKSMREIKHRMQAIQNIENVTRSMKTIASVRLRNIEGKTRLTRPYVQAMQQFLQQVLNRAEGLPSDPLLDAREVKNRCYLVVASDRGLCGSHNHDIVRYAETVIAGHPNARIVALGKYAYRHFLNLNYPSVVSYDEITDDIGFAVVKHMTARLIRGFLNREIDEVSLIYTKYYDPARQEPVVLRLLPIDIGSLGRIDGSGSPAEYLFDAPPEEILRFLLPQYVNTVVYQALLEAKMSEQAARMVAMDTATDNAEEMMDELKMEYSRSRQEMITEEIIETIEAAELSRS